MTTTEQPVAASGTFRLGGDLTVHRLGYGAMRITGSGIWGPPRDRDEALRVLRRAVELGVDFIDTADSYGPFVSEDLIREALHPYDGVVIATKGGLLRTGPDVWPICGKPDYLRQCVEMSLRRLGVERIDLWQLHRIDPEVPVEDSLGAVRELQEAGKIRHIGLSEVSVAEIEQARTVVDVVCVQNLYNLGNRQSEDVLSYCEQKGIGFIPWFPVAAGSLARPGGLLDEMAEKHEATHAQLALAWLLRRSPVMLPIPGTSSVAHLEENCAAAQVELNDEEYDALTAAGSEGRTMPQLRIGLAQVDPVVGDLPGNAQLVRQWTRRAVAQGCHLVAFPEMVLTGYPAEDLVLRHAFVQASLDALEQLAEDLAADGAGEVAVVVGYCGRTEKPAPALGRPAGEPQNSAAVLLGGKVVSRYAKHHLPNYGVFDEFRYFVRGDRLPVVRLHGIDVATVVCEDLWQEGGPLKVACSAGVGLIVCINGSPYERNKDDLRAPLAARRAAEAGAPVAYVNCVGGQDELVFDGDSFVVDAGGAVVARAAAWQEDLLVVDLDLAAASSSVTGPVDAGDGTTMTVERVTLSESPVERYEPQAPVVATPLDDCAEVWGALVTATRDYVEKNRFPSVILGLSGGIDSALVAAVARDALGADRVHVVGMPSQWSSDHSVSDAEDLAKRLGLHWQLVPIAPVVEAFLAQVDLTGISVENLQARIRGMILMGLSNEHGHLVLVTGNKSEAATGFSTLYGDSAGGFAPIKDVPKLLVFELSRWRNAVAQERGEVPPIPESTISKPPSAELAPGQVDADRLPPYEVLDPLLDAYVERDQGRADLIAAGFDEAVVDRVLTLVDSAEYKRRQSAPGPKITGRAFGRDRRLPITSRWREVAAPTAPEPEQARPEEA